MDQAVWAIWYDLQDQTQSEYIDWLHKEYLPILQSRPGFTWAAHYQSQGGGADMEKVRNTFPKSHGMEGLGKGTQFLMLVGATEPWVLLDPSVIHEERAITGKVKEMLNMRQNTRSCIFSVFA